ncbi:MAG: HAD hydrolase-like protein [Rhodobacteraceae bacterium]|nr:HAD hydrolase-like protein [Paracoccaceae bacterium]
MRTVIFDLDGTLADTGDDLIAAANATFVGHGFGSPLDPVADKATAFGGGRAMLRLGYSRLGRDADEDQISADYPVLIDHYARDIDRHTRLYPRAEAAVTGLRDAGYAVGICTNKPTALAEDLMRRLGVRDLFASLVGAGSFPVSKPDPAPYVASVERAGGKVIDSVLIGDTMTDRKTAAAAGVPCVLVTFGPNGRAVEAMQPEGLLDHYDELQSVVAGLLG